MYRIGATYVLIVCLGGCCPSEVIDKPSLVRRLEAFNQAFSMADTLVLSGMITDDYSHINGTSRPYTKREWLGYVASQAQKIQRGDLKIDRYSMDDVSISLYGRSAVVTGTASSQGVENGEPFNRQFRVTHLWAYIDNQWKRAAFHDGRIQ